MIERVIVQQRWGIESDQPCTTEGARLDAMPNVDTVGEWMGALDGKDDIG